MVFVDWNRYQRRYLIKSSWYTGVTLCFCTALHWRNHNEHDGVSNHQPHDYLLNGLFKRRSKETSKFRVTGLCAGHSPGTGEFHAQRASNAENVSIWWRLHGFVRHPCHCCRRRPQTFVHAMTPNFSITLILLELMAFIYRLTKLSD